MKERIIGIGVITIGAILLLANLGLYNMQELVATWWPVVLVAIGGLLLINDRKDYIWSVVFSLLGLLFLARNLEFISFEFGQIFLPGLLMIVGIGLLFGRHTQTRTSNKSEDNLTAILSGIEYKNSAKDFKGYKVTAVMGGAELDLSQATIKKEATITVFVLMGVAELRIPEDVIVKTRAMSIMGAVEEKGSPKEKSTSPVLYIDGNVLMGSVEIRR